MTPRFLAWRIVGLAVAAFACAATVGVLWVDSLVFHDLLGRSAPSADRLEGRLTAGSWQIRTTDGVIDISVAAAEWQATMHQAALDGDLTGAGTAVARLEADARRLRSAISESPLHPGDRSSRRDIHTGLAQLETGLAGQRAALNRGDPAGYYSAGREVAAGLDILTGAYGRGRP